MKELDKVIKDIKQEFGTKVCKDINPDCPNCKAQLLLGYLNWYRDLLKYGE